MAFPFPKPARTDLKKTISINILLFLKTSNIEMSGL